MALVTSGLLAGGCPVCGKQHAACGEPSTGVPVDQHVEVAAVAAPVKLYDVVMPNGVETRMKLNEDDAKRYAETCDVSAVEESTSGKARQARNKARTAQNKAAQE